jgi:hypothetical protein
MGDVQELLRRPSVVAAVRELGVSSLGVEDVLAALYRFGTVRVEVTGDAARRYACVLHVAGEEPERSHGATVLHAALACWAATLEGLRQYSDRGVAELEHFLNEP